MNPSVGSGTASSTAATVAVSFAGFPGRLSQVVRLALNALRNPSDDPRVALLVIAIIGVTLALVVVIVWLVASFVSGSEKGPDTEPAAPQGAIARSRRGQVLRWVLLLALLSAPFLGWKYGTVNAACARCHVMKSAVTSNAKDTHSQTACRTCHIAPGARGAYVAAVQAARNLGEQIRQISGSSMGAMPPAEVSNGACLSCHEHVKASVVLARGIRMRHSDVLGVGYRCTDCHNTAGHGNAVRRVRAPRMSQCIQCHDGTKAANDCSVCHSRDIGVAARNPTEGYVKVDIKTDGCRGCHSMAPCIQCHGIELPHSQAFIAGYHGRKALLEPNVCVKCHALSVCRKCHESMRPSASGVAVNPHANTVAEFVVWHRDAKGIGLGSCSCHDQDRQRFCNYCHGPQPSR
jgi:Cytochrome c7 and related cytochrome c